MNRQLTPSFKATSMEEYSAFTNPTCTYYAPQVKVILTGCEIATPRGRLRYLDKDDFDSTIGRFAAMEQQNRSNNSILSAAHQSMGEEGRRSIDLLARTDLFAPHSIEIQGKKCPEVDSSVFGAIFNSIEYVTHILDQLRKGQGTPEEQQVVAQTILAGSFEIAPSKYGRDFKDGRMAITHLKQIAAGTYTVGDIVARDQVKKATDEVMGPSYINYGLVSPMPCDLLHAGTELRETIDFHL